MITDPTKYFGCELGAQTNFDMKNERFIVNGEHDAAKLQDILDGFIRKFVLCAACENPETTLVCYNAAFYQWMINRICLRGPDVFLLAVGICYMEAAALFT